MTISQRMVSKRGFLIGLAAAGLAGCEYTPVPDPTVSSLDEGYLAQVGEADLDVKYSRYIVEDPTGQPPGTISVDTDSCFLHYSLPDRKAVRYGVAVGDEAYGWKGRATVARKAEWPSWMPPADMVQRWPYLQPIVAQGGMKGGPQNPLGARALYLYDHGRDTLYRIHGTNDPISIGKHVSSGCIRMRNIDVIELYNRAPVGATVMVG